MQKKHDNRYQRIGNTVRYVAGGTIFEYDNKSYKNISERVIETRAQGLLRGLIVLLDQVEGIPGIALRTGTAAKSFSRYSVI